MNKGILNDAYLLTVWGGVFTPDDQGWVMPIISLVDSTGTCYGVTLDSSTQQVSNQYSCAMVTLYDAQNDITYNNFLGGIGAYQWNGDTLEYGDNGVPLPFVNLISTISYNQFGTVQQVQSPLNGLPLLPDLIGSNAIFYPFMNYLLPTEESILNYNALPLGNTLVGYMIGGIKATAPTSSKINPTYVNEQVYGVYINKL
ncbi:MAG: hypothetical protein HC842_02410 [Cytophagales bacterium]|nr:hypothetical protein [Cytophagales bacterium]